MLRKNMKLDVCDHLFIPRVCFPKFFKKLSYTSRLTGIYFHRILIAFQQFHRNGTSLMWSFYLFLKFFMFIFHVLKNEQNFLLFEPHNLCKPYARNIMRWIQCMGWIHLIRCIHPMFMLSLILIRFNLAYTVNNVPKRPLYYTFNYILFV